MRACMNIYLYKCNEFSEAILLNSDVLLKYYLKKLNNISLVSFVSNKNKNIF